MIEVLIPACGEINHRLPFLRPRSRTPALIPVHTRALASYIIEFYRKNGPCLVSLLVDEERETEIREDLGADTPGFRILPIRPTRGVVGTLEAGLKLAEHDEIIVNLITTIPTSFPGTSSIGASETRNSSSEWSRIQVGAGGVLAFLRKDDPQAGEGYAFNGIIRASRAGLARACAETETKTDLISIAKNLHEAEGVGVVHSDWIDCGHETNFFEARAKLLNSRLFNSIQIDPVSGVLTKRSSHAVKLGHEFDFMRRLPVDLRPFFPRAFGELAEDPPFARYSIEYYAYPNLAEYLLFWSLSASQWERIFRNLREVLVRLASHRGNIPETVHQSFYLDRFAERIAAFAAQLTEGGPPGPIDTGRELVVNGVPCLPFAELVERLAPRISQLYRAEDIRVMHGDFCFGNILCDIPSGIIRLIDPRGSFGSDSVGIHGDRKYDLAKLYHSAVSGYDYFANDMFSVEVTEGNRVEYKLSWRENRAVVAGLAIAMIRDLNISLDEIALINSLLFLSMVPLHRDSPARQVALYAHGIKMLNQQLLGTTNHQEHEENLYRP